MAGIRADRRASDRAKYQRYYHDRTRPGNKELHRRRQLFYKARDGNLPDLARKLASYREFQQLSRDERDLWVWRALATCGSASAAVAIEADHRQRAAQLQRAVEQAWPAAPLAP